MEIRRRSRCVGHRDWGWRRRRHLLLLLLLGDLLDLDGRGCPVPAVFYLLDDSHGVLSIRTSSSRRAVSRHYMPGCYRHSPTVADRPGTALSDGHVQEARDSLKPPTATATPRPCRPGRRRGARARRRCRPTPRAPPAGGVRSRHGEGRGPGPPQHSEGRLLPTSAARAR